MSETASWKEKIGAFSPNFVTSPVDGKPQRFFAVRVGLMFELRTVGRPLAKSLAVLFNKNENDTNTEETILRRDAGTFDQNIKMEAVSEGLAKMRLAERVNAIDGLVESLTSAEHLELVGKIIMDSMHDVFPSGCADNPPPKEFIDSLPLPSLTECLVGVVKANKGVFGPLANQVTETFERSVARMVERSKKQADETLEAKASEAPSENPTPTGG